MTYALGRRVEYYDMPAMRAIVRDAAQQRQPHVVVRPRRREQRGVPDERSADDRDRRRRRTQRLDARSEATRRRR